MKNKWFVFGTLGFAVAIFIVFSLQKKSVPGPPPTPVSATSESSVTTPSKVSESFVRPHSPRFGNSMARVTVVEWLDPECEACRAIYPAVKKIIAEYGDRVHFVVRYMAYHQGSMFAATALEEAREFGKYEEALGLLFEKQPEWGDHQKPQPELIPTYLVKLGIPLERLDKGKLIAKHGENIQLDQDDGKIVGVQGTPAFFINEKPLKELGEAALRAAIEQEIARN